MGTLKGVEQRTRLGPAGDPYGGPFRGIWRRTVPPSQHAGVDVGIFAQRRSRALSEEVRFAVDTPLEEGGFEPSVPLGS